MGLKNLGSLKREVQRLTSERGAGGGGGGDNNYVKMPDSEGVVILRILPPVSGDVADLFVATRIHNINGQRVHCPNELDPATGYFNGPCPICKYVRYLWKLSDGKPKDEAEALKAEAREITANERYYYAVVVKSQTGQYKGNKPNPIDTPLIWSIGKQQHAKILVALDGNEKDLEKPLGDITAFDGEGRNFKVVKKNDRGDNGKVYPKYDQSKFEDRSDAGTREQWEQWMGSLPDLKALRVLPTIDELDLEIAYHRRNLDDPRQAGFDVSKYDNFGSRQGHGGGHSAPPRQAPPPPPEDDYVPPPRGNTRQAPPPAASRKADPFASGGGDTGVVSEDFLDALGPPPM